MTTVTVQAPQKVVTTVEPPVTVEVYRKGDEGDSAYEVAVANGFVGTEEEWLASLKGEKGDPGSFTMTEGEKHSLVDAGTLFDMSITDDYLYICVQTGTAGNAKWKKAVLFYSE